MTDFLTVITLVEYIIMLICHGFTIYFFGSIIYWSGFRKFHLGMNLSMQFYVFIEFAFSMSCIISYGYLTIFWRPDENIYDAYWMFVTGSFASVLLITQPLVSCFLGLDRCFCLIFPFKNAKFWNRIVFGATLIGVAIFWGLEIPLYILQAIPTKAETACRSFGCLVPAGNQLLFIIFRYSTGIGSVVIGVALFKLFSNKVTKQYSFKNTKLVVITLIAAILLYFMPSFISFCMATFLNINLTKTIGPFSATFAFFNSVVCGYQYFTKLGQLSNLKKVVITSTNNGNKIQNLSKSVPKIVR